MEKLIVEEICKKYGKSTNFIKLLIKICKDNNIVDIKNTIEKFLLSVSKSVSKNKKQHL